MRRRGSSKLLQIALDFPNARNSNKQKAYPKQPTLLQASRIMGCYEVRAHLHEALPGRKTCSVKASKVRYLDGS